MKLQDVYNIFTVFLDDFVTPSSTPPNEKELLEAQPSMSEVLGDDDLSEVAIHDKIYDKWAFVYVVQYLLREVS